MEVPAEPLIDALAERGFANLTARGDDAGHIRRRHRRTVWTSTARAVGIGED